MTSQEHTRRAERFVALAESCYLFAERSDITDEQNAAALVNADQAARQALMHVSMATLLLRCEAAEKPGAAE